MTDACCFSVPAITSYDTSKVHFDLSTLNSLLMAARRRTAYPRATIRKILAGHSQKKIGRSVDTLVYLNYILFIDALMQNAERKAKESAETRIAARDLRKVTMTTLRKFKG